MVFEFKKNKRICFFFAQTKGIKKGQETKDRRLSKIK